MTSENIHNAISSPESGCGQSPSNSLDGRYRDLFGQEVAPAKTTAQREREKAQAVTGTYGQIGLTSSASAALQKYLVSKLQARLPLVGPMQCKMIWKKRRTPSHRWYYQLAASGLSTREGDYGLWRSPLSSDGEKSGHGNLPHQAKETALWATPNTMDGIGLRSQEAKEKMFQSQRKNRTAPSNLREQVVPTMWSTPSATDGKRGGFQTEKMTGVSLTQTVNSAMWPTPRAQFSRGTWEGRDPKKGKDLQTLVSLTVQTENKGQLNPEFACWLMGIPIEFLSSMQSAMASFRKSPRNLSKQQCEGK